MNICVLVGRLTKDPELRFTPGVGKAVCTFTLAVNRSYTNKEGKREADFFNIVVWGKPAENCSNYLKKGSMASIKGEIRNRSYETDKGKRYITEIIAERVNFLDSKNKDKQTPDKSFEPTGLDQGGFQALDDDDIPF